MLARKMLQEKLDYQLNGENSYLMKKKRELEWRETSKYLKTKRKLEKLKAVRNLEDGVCPESTVDGENLSISRNEEAHVDCGNGISSSGSNSQSKIQQ